MWIFKDQNSFSGFDVVWFRSLDIINLNLKPPLVRAVQASNVALESAINLVFPFLYVHLENKELILNRSVKTVREVGSQDGPNGEPVGLGGIRLPAKLKH